jgi:hypothetical protein
VVYLENKIQIELNKKFLFNIDKISNNLQCGRVCIANINSNNELRNLYLLDSDNKPFQVYGGLDVLLEGAVIYDETKELVKLNAYAVQICIQAFNVLHKLEIELNKNILLDIENIIFDYIFSKTLGYKMIKKSANDYINSLDLPDDVKLRMIESINVAPMPRTALGKHISLNLEEYPNSKIIRW